MLPEEVHSRREEFSFVDVRQDYEFEAGHVEGSVHITLQELPARVDEVDTSRPVVITCQIGQRSGLAAEFLRSRGVDAHNLEGGLEAWVKNGYPLVASQQGGRVVDGWAEQLEW